MREGVDEMRLCTTRLLELIDASPVDYDLVVGFSQGGEYALQIASRVHELRVRKPPLRFATLGTQVAFVVERYAAAGTPLVFSSTPGISAFVVAGDGDPSAMHAMAESLSACREAGLNVASCEWSGGHAMPPEGDEAYAAMVRHLFA